MSCLTTATATEFSTATSLGVSTSFSDSVTTLTSSSLTTIVTLSCSGAAVPDRGSAPATICVPFTTVSTVTGVIESVVQVPVQVTFTSTSTVPTATLFSTSCDTTTLTSSSTLSNGSVVTSAVTSTLTASPTAGSRHSSSHTGAIVGGVVGGVGGLLLLLLLLLCACWRTRAKHADVFRYDDSDVLAPQMVHHRRGMSVDMLDSEPRPYPYTYDTSAYEGPSNSALSRSASFPNHSTANMESDSAVPPAMERSASDSGGVLGVMDMDAAGQRAYPRPPLRVANASAPNQAGIGLRDIKDPALFAVQPAAGANYTNEQGPYVHEDGGARFAVHAADDAHSVNPPPVYTAE